MNYGMIYEQIRENDEYVLICREVLYYLGQDANSEIIKELKRAIKSISDCEENAKSYGLHIHHLAIKKDSTIGEYLLEKCKDKDNYITHKHIASALLVAIAEDNVKLSNKIMSLFKSKISGEYRELSENIPEYLLEYIKENNDYDRYLEEVRNVSDKEYYVYEDGEIERKSLSLGKVEVKK